MTDLHAVGGMRKLNNDNYNTWSTCMMSYMQGQDLWEIVNGGEIEQPEAECKWHVEKMEDKSRQGNVRLEDNSGGRFPGTHS
ncbi:hypothetical protein GQ457_14G005550 [Hibiscus cannabinus]